MSLWSAMKEGWHQARMVTREEQVVSEQAMLAVIMARELEIRNDMRRVVETLGGSIEAAARLAGVALAEVARDLPARRQAEIAAKIREVEASTRMWQEIRDTLHEGGPPTR